MWYIMEGDRDKEREYCSVTGPKEFGDKRKQRASVLRAND